MFLIGEIDKILEKVASPSNERKRRGTERLHISLADVERINVENLLLPTKIRYPFGHSSNAILDDMFKTTDIDELNKLLYRENQMTTDGLLASLLIPLVVSKLKQSKPNHYPYSKLIICDRISHNLLLKFQRILFASGSSKLRNILYKPPFDVTAIFLLDDLIDLLDREGDQVYYMKYDASSKRYVATYNYSIARKSIPFLKVSDLVIILNDKRNLELGNFSMKSSHEHQVLQLFSHFSRNSELVELKSITKLIGVPHLLYNNVLEIQPFHDSSADNSHEHTILGFSKLNLSYLSSIAETLIQLANRLSLDLMSISYRTNDAHNQTKLLTEFISVALNSSRASKFVNDMKARVLVIDRFHDLRGPLHHADRYGAFLDQEKHSETRGERSLKLRIDTVDELDEKLQLDQLTEVLSSILKYSVNLKPRESKQKPVSPMKYQPSMAMVTSQSICRHLDRVKAIYKCLSEGYLLIVKLESNLESIVQEICNLRESLSAEDQTILVDRVQRAASALKQLIKISGKSIGVSDMVRVACILNDVINMFLYQIRNQSSSNKSIKVLNEIKSTFLRSKVLKKLLKPMLDSTSEEEFKSSLKIIDSFDSFEKISRENCQNTSALTLEQVVEKFCLYKLEEDTSYSTVDLSKNSNQRNVRRGKEILIITFLGSLSPYELSKLKLLEKSMKKNQQSGVIILLVCDILRPEEFLRSL